MKKIISALLALAVGALFLFSCGGASPATEIGQLQKEDGTFIYPGLAWGMTVGEAASAAGWTISEPQMVYNEKGEHVDTVASVQKVSFGKQEWSAQLQFDPDGGLWSITLVQNGDSAALGKIFKSYDKEMTDAYGSPAAADYDRAMETVNSTVLDSTVTWEVLDGDGEHAGGLALSYRRVEGGNAGSLALAMNCKK